jgi:transposase
MTSYQDLKRRVASLREQAATHKARLEQAEAQVREKERQIQETYGVAPDQLAEALAKAEKEIEETGAKLLASLEAAGV